MYDLLIIGGGPAGLSAAMTARNRNLSVCVICGGAADSALHKAGHVTNYPGVPDVSGPALLETMTQQARDLGADILRERALSAMPMGKTFGVSAGKEFVEGRALLLATGIAQRGTFPGETDYLGRGVSYCATCDGMLYRGKRAWRPTLRQRRISCGRSAVTCIIMMGKSTALRSAAPSAPIRSWSTAQRSRRTSFSSCARALRLTRSCPVLPRKRATSSWMKLMLRAFPAFSRPGTVPARPIRSQRQSVRATARRFRLCAGSETLDKRHGRAYNFPIHLRRRGGVVSRRTSERRRLVQAFRMPEMKVAPEQPA